ncbi:MAG: NAD(P)H-dependent oxidoreductase, partial [Alphaproteobacteria bacterium]|nr:NAD(P)H-dependent oxidoreductase [Alphaproteobacteria bacterium]
TSAETYAHDGRSGDINLLLWPINFTLAYVGFTVLEPFVAYGVEAGLRYSDSGVVETRLKEIEAKLAACMADPEAVPTIPFNTMSEWGADGRIQPGAPAHSPFIRHRERLELD